MSSDPIVKPHEAEVRLLEEVRAAQAEWDGAPQDKRSAARQRFADALLALTRLVFDGEIPEE